jgi:hypothetical protein
MTATSALPPVTERTNDELIAGIAGATIIISCRAKMFEKMAVDWYDESREELLRRCADSPPEPGTIPIAVRESLAAEVRAIDDHILAAVYFYASGHREPPDLQSIHALKEAIAKVVDNQPAAPPADLNVLKNDVHRHYWRRVSGNIWSCSCGAQASNPPIDSTVPPPPGEPARE